MLASREQNCQSLGNWLNVGGATMKKGSLATKGPEGKGAPRPRIRDFSQSLPMLLLRGREAVMRYFRPSLLEHGVTEQQWRVLRALSTADEMEVMVLADATYLLAPSLSRILKDLQRRGLVRRRSDRHDLRRNLVAIAPKGNELIDTLSPRSEVIYAEICRRFGQKNFDLLQELLRELEGELLTSIPANSGLRAASARKRRQDSVDPAPPPRASSAS
jgi:homoprotocatechuate degradation regulator HpaR